MAQGGGGGCFGISADGDGWPGWLKDFFGFEIFQYQDFFGLVNLASIFWGGLIFLGIKNNLKIRGIFPPFDHPCHLTDSLPPTPGLQKIYGIVIDLIFFKKEITLIFK